MTRPASGVAASLFPIVVGAACWRLSRWSPALDPLLLGMLAGVAASVAARGRWGLRAGCERARRGLLPLGILLYATQVRLDKATLTSVFVAVQVFVGTIGAYVAALWAARRLGLGDKAALLVFAGTSVCGASAIAVAAPAIRARREDYAAAVLGVSLWGLVGIILYPFLFRSGVLEETAYALLAGTTLPMTGFAAHAAAAAGPSGVAVALAAKSLRTASLIAIVPLLGAQAAASGGGAPGRLRSAAGLMAAFFAVVLLSSFAPWSVPARDAAGRAAPAVLSAVMAAVGASVDVDAARPAAAAAAGTALAAWAAVIAAFAGGMYYFGY